MRSRDELSNWFANPKSVMMMFLFLSKSKFSYCAHQVIKHITGVIKYINGMHGNGWISSQFDKGV